MRHPYIAATTAPSTTTTLSPGTITPLDTITTTTAISTGTSPSEWRECGAAQSRRVGTDWPTIINQRQDALRLMETECPSCGCKPCPTPSFCAVCRGADQRKAAGWKPQYVSEWTDWPETPGHIRYDWDSSNVSLDALFNRPSGTPQSTIEAILCGVRARGVGALNEPANIERLSQCDEWARAEINQQIKKITGGDNASVLK